MLRDRFSNSGSTVLAAIGAVLFILGCTAMSVMIHGLVLQQLWRWFVEPIGGPAIGAAHAIGIAMLVNFILLDKARRPDVAGFWQMVMRNWIGEPAMFLLLGYILHRIAQ